MSFARSTRRRLAVGALLAGVAVAIVGARSLVRDDHAPVRTSASGRSAESEVPATPGLHAVAQPQPTVPVREWRAGARRTYTYKSTRAYRLAPRTQGAHETRFELRLDGALVLTVAGVEADVVHLHAELRDAHLSSSGASSPLDIDTAQLRRPFFVTLDRAGRVVSFRFDETIDGETREQLRAVLASMQFVAPDRPERVEWLAVEQDGTGEYIAGYSCAGTLPTVRKTKQQYTRVQSANGLVPVAEVGSYEVASRGTVALEPDGWPRSVDEDETLVVSLPKQSYELSMASKVSATLVKIDEAPELADAFDREGAKLEASTFDHREQLAAASARMDKSRVAGADFRKMLAELESLSPESRDDQRRAHVMLTRLEALFRLDPKAAAEARDAVLKRPHDVTSRIIVGGLSAAGTPEAQRALVSVMRASEAPSETRVGAVVGLGLSPNPTPEAMKATEAGIRSSDPAQRSASTLALGNQIREVRASEPAAASSALDTLLALLEGATTVGDVVLYLEAIGNAADPRALPVIQRYLTHESWEIRAAAYGALRFIAGAEVDELLVAGLVTNPEPRVRIAVLTAISFRDIRAFAEVILAVLRTDPSKAVRNQALALVVRHADKIEGAGEAIAWAAKNDPDPEVRAVARHALSSAGEPSPMAAR